MSTAKRLLKFWVAQKKNKKKKSGIKVFFVSLICQFWKTFALSGTFISSLASLIDLPSIYKFWKGEGDGFQLVFKLSFNEIKCGGMGHSTVFSTFSGSVFFFFSKWLLNLPKGKPQPGCELWQWYRLIEHTANISRGRCECNGMEILSECLFLLISSPPPPKKKLARKRKIHVID